MNRRLIGLIMIIFIPMIVLIPFILSQQSITTTVPKPVQFNTSKGFVIRFENFALLDPKVETQDGVTVDPKAGTIMAKPGVKQVQSQFAAMMRATPTPSCEITFTIPDSNGGKDGPIEATFDKVGNLTHSDVSYSERDLG